MEGSRTIDLKASLDDAGGSELVAYAAGRLHVEKAGRHYLLLGVDDGVRVSVDGAVVFSRDDARPVRDDDDVIALDLAAGDHDIVLKLHQRDGAWAFRAKLVDGSLAPPAGAYLALPGTTADDARALAARMSWLVVDRAFDARGAPPRYRPVLTVRYPEGAPRGVPIPVTAKLSGVPEASAFDVRAGGVAVNASGVSDLVVSLPAIDPWTGTATLETTVAGRIVKSTIVARPQSERALVRAERARSRVKGDETWLLPGSLDSVQHLAHRLSRFLARGDGDGEAQAEEARELDRLAANLERGVDPYEGRSGMMRRAVVTPFDGAPSELGLYVPPSYKRGESRKYPLVVGLHGMNSYPMSMMRALFGLDDEKKDPFWKDRHLVPPQDVPAVDAFVITPYAHGNTMYRGDRRGRRPPHDEVGVDSLPDRRDADHHHRAVDGRDRLGVDPVPLPARLRRVRAAVRLSQLPHSPGHGRASEASVGAPPPRGALERVLGGERRAPPALDRARDARPPRGEQRRPHRAVREAEVLDQARSPRGGPQRLGDHVRRAQGDEVAALAAPRPAPRARALPDDAHALRDERVGHDRRARDADVVGRRRRAHQEPDGDLADDQRRLRDHPRAERQARRSAGRRSP